MGLSSDPTSLQHDPTATVYKCKKCRSDLKAVLQSLLALSSWFYLSFSFYAIKALAVPSVQHPPSWRRNGRRCLRLEEEISRSSDVCIRWLHLHSVFIYWASSVDGEWYTWNWRQGMAIEPCCIFTPSFNLCNECIESFEFSSAFLPKMCFKVGILQLVWWVSSLQHKPCIALVLPPDGSSLFPGERCPCGSWVTPAIHIQSSKVDKCIPPKLPPPKTWIHTAPLYALISTELFISVIISLPWC